MDLLEHAKMSTLLGLIAKLPPRLAGTSVRLQLILAWANNELLRPAPAHTALDRVDTLLTHSNLPDSDVADLRAEISVVKAESLLFADHVTGIKELVADCLARPDKLRPWVVSAAAGIAAFAEVYSFDFAAARRIQDWALPYHDRAGGPYSVVWGHCITGIADNEQLHIHPAENHFREGLRIATEAGGPHSHSAASPALYSANCSTNAARSPRRSDCSMKATPSAPRAAWTSCSAPTSSAPASKPSPATPTAPRTDSTRAALWPEPSPCHGCAPASTTSGFDWDWTLPRTGHPPPSPSPPAASRSTASTRSSLSSTNRQPS